MSSTSSLVLIAVLLLAAAPRGSAAQQVRPRIPPLPATSSTSPAAVAANASPVAPHSGQSLLNTLLYGAGGAVLGSWAGYMTSQIVWSDWQAVSHKNGISRLRYTVTGAGIGALAGALLGRDIHPTAGEPRPVFGTRPAITREQIEASATRNVQELVQLLRPQWLNPRGNDIIQFVDSTAAPLQPGLGVDVVRVYLDGELLGGPDQLAEIPTPEVLRVEYYDVRAATLRWGAGHSHGAIDIITAKGQGE